MDGDNDTPPIKVLQNDMAAPLPGKQKTRFFKHFYCFSAFTGPNFNCLNPHKLSRLIRFRRFVDFKVE